MALLNIGGVDLKTPSTYSCELSEIRGKSITSANGSQYFEVVAIKRKIQISYRILSQNDLSTLMKLIKPSLTNINSFFVMTYFDAYSNSNLMSTFSVDNMEQSSELMKSGLLYFKDVSFTFLEQ